MFQRRKNGRRRLYFVQERRLNNVGLLIYQAANLGRQELESVFNTLPDSEVVKGINHADRHGITPLILAARRGCLGSVKLLLYHGADLDYTLKRPIHAGKVWHIAKKAGHLYLEQYLRKCHDDMKILHTTRAQLEMTVRSIATDPYCSLDDQEQFDVCLKEIIAFCDFDIEGTCEHEDDTQPLLINTFSNFGDGATTSQTTQDEETEQETQQDGLHRGCEAGSEFDERAAHADNICIVIRLIEAFRVNVEAHDLMTAETILHIACQKKSKLRFYLVKHHPCLLRKRDIVGRLPLHFSCKNNDIVFVSWLLGNILAQTGSGVGLDENSSSNIMRARSMSDILSSSKTIRPNKSLQGVFPMTPVDLVSSKPTYRIPSPDNAQEDKDHDDVSSTHNSSLREESLLFSYESNRSFSYSFHGGSRSGSSERSLPTKSPNQSILQSSGSVSSYDVTELCLIGTHESDNEEASRGNDPRVDTTYGCDGSAECNGGVTHTRNLQPYLDDLSSKPLLPAEVDTLLDLEKIMSHHPLSLADIVDMKPFTMDEKGDTVFHILARENNSTVLGVLIRVADFLKHRVKLDMLTSREGFYSRLPIEEALHAKGHKCVQQLIQLSLAAGLMPELLMDPHLIKCAVFVNDIHLVRILIENGFHQGLMPAISLAIMSEYTDILRTLLFWQTQVINSTKIARRKIYRGRMAMLLNNGVIKWEEIQLEAVHGQWIADAIAATNTVSKLLRFSCLQSDITEKNIEYFKSLGIECLQYFDNVTCPLQSMSLQVPLAPITEVNICENQLRYVPVELFQMQHLRVLRLSHNTLTELPSSPAFSEHIYTSQIAKLDLDWNDLKELPEDMFRGLALSLRELSVQYNQLEKLPPGIWVMPKLKKVKLAHNKLKRLHVLSRPHYFNDLETSKLVSTFFATDDRGDLVCTSITDAVKMQQYTWYLKRLANFYLTVCAARGCNIFLNADTIFQEVLDIHTTRSNKVLHKDEEEHASFTQEPQILRMFEEDEDLESAIKCTMELELLDLSYNKFKQFPWDLACIVPKLQKLDIRGNALTLLDIVHSIPNGLHSLILVKNDLMSLNKVRSLNLPCGNPMRLLRVQDDLVSDGYCQHCKHSTLEKLSNLMLDHNKLDYFPIVGTPQLEAPDITTGFSDYQMVRCDTYYPDLSILSLANNRFSAVPSRLDRLAHLSSLNLSFNNIVELPLDMGLMNSNLLLLKLDGLFLRNIPVNLLAKPKQLLHHLKALKQNSRPYRRMKLMLVGGTNIGKTSLLINLVKKGKMKRFTEVGKGVNDLPLSTVGVELGNWEYSQGGKPKVTFMTWDFGGQEEYYATHQCFLTQRSLYLLLWNVLDGEAGLRSLRPWLENIESRAPKSPVIAIATHLDLIPQAKRGKEIAHLQAKFRDLYIRDTHRTCTYPKIHNTCQFISINSTKSIDSLRDYIYEFSIQYKVQVGPNSKDVKPLLDEPIPESYIVLQDIVQETAEKCINQNMKPILTKKAFLQSIRESPLASKFTEADMEQATSFLHDSGILLHFEDSSRLKDLYFINPQWLCSMLAKLITIREHNPYQRQGFMLMTEVCKVYNEDPEDFMIIMQKFEVVLLLDDKRLLIPSLLPDKESESCLVFSHSILEQFNETADFHHLPADIPHVQMYETPHPIMYRYYLLPFIPNGFFSRVVARLMSSEIINLLNKSLVNSPLGLGHISNSAHWKCWRNGILITWSHFEIFRIAPLSSTLAGMDKVGVITKKNSCELVHKLKGIEIKVAILPEAYIGKCCILEGQLCSSTRCRDPNKESENSTGKCLATWILHQATTIIDSVFEDWYESFAKNKGFDPQQEYVRIANPCNQCMVDVQKEQVRQASGPLSSSSGTTKSSKDRVCYMFTSPYAVYASTSEGNLVCPNHGTLRITDVAPDLVFCDFLPGSVFTNLASLVIKQRLGDGGFGTVYKANLHTGGEVRTVAAKKYSPDMIYHTEEDPDLINQIRAWDVYQKASMEARVMYQLSHPNILGLVGIALHPFSLLVELAPEGDLRKCVERFKREKVKLSRRTLQCTLVQVAEALNYLHSKQFIYRDLKPENILVWKFPRPENQWCSDASIYVKVADYGISKQITPQGIRGVEGTRPYLPPEVILHGGREAYSTKLDVYAFGMFIYYLVSFKSPFDSGRPISALLEEGKRPELPPKMRPSSIQIFELMCWCWSEIPCYRPDFPTIIKVLKTDVFTHLLASFPLIGNEEEVTTSCIRLFRKRKCATSSSSVDVSLASMGASCLLPSKSSMGCEEFGTQVWYGTEFGKYGVIQFQNSGITHETFELTRNQYISTIRLVYGRIWVATVGHGLLVYNPSNKEMVAQWGVQDRYQIYTFMEIQEFNLVLVLTHRGMFVFDSDTTAMNNSENCFIPKLELTKLQEEINLGVVFPSSANISTAEVWLTSQQAKTFYILTVDGFTIKEKVEFDPTKFGSNLVRHMIPVEANRRMLLAIASKHNIHLIDVVERKLMSEHFNCHEICSNIRGFQTNCRGDRVTALTPNNHFLYAATRRGLILCLNCSTMQVVHVMDAYYKPCRSLLLVNTSGVQSRPFQRLFSRGRSNRTLSSSSTLDSSSTNSFPCLNSLRGSHASNQRSSVVSCGSFDGEDDSNSSVLVSFGVGYRGVVGDCTTCPENFMLPSEDSKTFTQPGTPNRSIGYLLLWSTEVDEKKDFHDTDLIECDEDILPDSAVEAYPD